MDKLALVLAILSLAIGSVGYWRSGGQHDVEVLRQEVAKEIEVIRTKQRELTDTVAASTRAAYEASQERIRRMAEQLAELRKDATESMKKQVDLATKQMEELEGRIADGIKAVKETTAEKARATEEALAKRVHRLEARVDALRAKREINLALAKAKQNDFDKADEYLQEAVALLKDARETLGNDYAYESELSDVSESLRQAVAAIKAHAADVQARIEKVVTRSDTLLSALESDEQAAEVAKK
jgi:TolA-binding protein